MNRTRIKISIGLIRPILPAATLPQAETLTQSRQLGTLSLALRSLADAGETALPNDDERAVGRRAGINTVRFGISTMSTPK